jgi:S-DNA-T family DNA segregation ATPase FtsK/SpoIIIE
MIGRPDAANLTGVGRAYLRIGEDEVFDLFQTAWSGAPVPTPDSPDVSGTVVEVDLDGTRHSPRAEMANPPTNEPKQTQLQALIESVCTAAAARGIERLQGPWLPLLPESLDLGAVRDRDSGGWDSTSWQSNARWLAPVIGLVDDPQHQIQELLVLPLGAEGNAAIVGAPGSGKSTLLRTLVSSLALDHPPSDVHVYLWDSSGALKDLERLPHVGAVVHGSEPERVERWWWLLRNQLAQRVGTELSRPAIVVAIDNYTVFAAAHEQIAEDLSAFAQQCAGAGIYLVVTSSGPLPYRLFSSFPVRVALELTDAAEYPDIVGDTRVDADTSARLVPRRGVRGRGLVAHPPREFQTARPPDLDTERMRTASAGQHAVPVDIAPEVLSLGSVLDLSEAPSSAATPLGVHTDSLDVLRIDLDEGPHFAVTGPHRSGKSTALQTWLLGLAAQQSPAQAHIALFDFGLGAELGALRTLPHVLHIDDPERARQAVEQIGEVLQQRRQVGRQADDARIIVVVDDVDQFEAAAPRGKLRARSRAAPTARAGLPSHCVGPDRRGCQ